MERVERPTVTKWRLSRLHPTENTATTQEPALTFTPWLLADSTFQMSTASPAGSFSSLESARQSQYIFCPALWRPAAAARTASSMFAGSMAQTFLSIEQATPDG
jgi:hypothetical protein